MISRYCPGCIPLVSLSWFRKKVAQNLADIKITPRLYSPCIFFASSFSRVGGMGGWWEANLSNDTHRQPSNQDLENNQKTKTKILQLFFLPSVTKDFFLFETSSWILTSNPFFRHITTYWVIFSPKVHSCAMWPARTQYLHFNCCNCFFNPIFIPLISFSKCPEYNLLPEKSHVPWK